MSFDSSFRPSAPAMSKSGFQWAEDPWQRRAERLPRSHPARHATHNDACAARAWHVWHDRCMTGAGHNIWQQNAGFSHGFQRFGMAKCWVFHCHKWCLVQPNTIEARLEMPNCYWFMYKHLGFATFCRRRDTSNTRINIWIAMNRISGSNIYGFLWIIRIDYIRI